MILLLFYLLVAGAVVLAGLAYFYPHLIQETAGAHVAGAAASGLALLVWLAMRARLPLTVTLSEWPAAMLLPPWNWRVDELAWHFSGVVLLLTLGAVLAASSELQVASNKLQVASDKLQVASNKLQVASNKLQVASNKLQVASDKLQVAGGGWRPPLPALLLLLAAATLAALWADSMAGLLAGWMLLAVVWAATLWLAGDTRPDAAGWLLRVGWLLPGLFALWWSAAAVPAAPSLTTNTWPAPTTTVLLAVILQMGVWPLSLWRPLDDSQLAPAIAPLIHIYPTVTGAALLARLVAGNPVDMAYGLLLTALALLGFLRGLRLAWAHLHQPAALAAAIALVQTSTVLLAGIWAGPAAVVAEVRVLVLAVGILFLLGGRPAGRRRGWRNVSLSAVGPLVALAALAALPFTAGFAGRAALYDAWLANGRFVLVLVAALLHAPLVAAILLSLWQPTEAVESLPDEKGPAGRTLMGDIGLLLPAAGLLSLNGPGQASAVSWLALVAAAVAGFVLSRYVGEVREARAALRQAFSLNVPLAAAAAGLRRLGQGVKTAVGEAVLILEGEGGFLWVLVLAVVFLLAL